MNYNEIFEMLFVHDVQLFVILISIKHTICYCLFGNMVIRWIGLLKNAHKYALFSGEV